MNQVILLCLIVGLYGLAAYTIMQNNKQQKETMATLADIEKDVKDQKTLVDGLSALIDGLRQQIVDILSGANLPPDVQARIDGVFAGMEENKAKMTTALQSGVGPEKPVIP